MDNDERNHPEHVLRALGRLPADPVVESLKHEAQTNVATPQAEIETLRSALKPFAEIGERLHAANQVSDQSVLIGASANRLKLDPLTGWDFVNAYRALAANVD